MHSLPTCKNYNELIFDPPEWSCIIVWEEGELETEAN